MKLAGGIIAMRMTRLDVLGLTPGDTPIGRGAGCERPRMRTPALMEML